MKKLFISQPMNGKTDEQILEERSRAMKAAGVELAESVTPVNSFFDGYDPGHGCVPLKFLARSIDLLADADVACFTPGWKEARGCRIEHECAVAYGIPVILISEEGMNGQ